MQICPECGTQYEDHVPTCMADGARLVQTTVVQGTPAQESPPRRSPPPPPSASSPQVQAQRSRAQTGIPFILALAAMGGGGLAAIVGGTILWSQLGTASPTLTSDASGTQAPAPARIPEPPLPPPTPAPTETNENPPVEVPLLSNPSGAKVFENDQFVCETPCAVKHPPHAPLPRFFVFRAPGFRDATHEMTDATGPISVQLGRQRNGPAPAQPTNATPRPTIGRDR